MKIFALFLPSPLEMRLFNLPPRHLCLGARKQGWHILVLTCLPSPPCLLNHISIASFQQHSFFGTASLLFQSLSWSGTWWGGEDEIKCNLLLLLNPSITQNSCGIGCMKAKERIRVTQVQLSTILFTLSWNLLNISDSQSEDTWTETTPPKGKEPIS